MSCMGESAVMACEGKLPKNSARHKITEDYSTLLGFCAPSTTVPTRKCPYINLHYVDQPMVRREKRVVEQQKVYKD